jgi:hypothetical protein
MSEKGSMVFRDETKISLRYPKYALRIKFLCRKYRKLLELEDWEIDVSFHDIMRNSKGVPDKNPKGAECDAEPKYYQAQLKFYLETLNEGEKYDELDDYIRHEFLHIIVWNMGLLAQQFARCIHEDVDDICADAEELLVETLTRFAFWGKLK